jgi:hypothetical protein
MTLKKFFLLVFFIAFVPAILLAGEEDEFKKRRKKKKKKAAFEQGQVSFSVGAGFPSQIRPDTDTLRYFGTLELKTQPVYFLRGEFGVTDNIGVGGFIGLGLCKATYTDNTDPENINGFKFTSFVIGARPAFHLPMKSEKLDVYVAGIIGFNAVSKKPIDIEHKKLVYGGHVGANFYFLDKIGAFAEVGYGMAIVNAGIVLKL